MNHAANNLDYQKYYDGDEVKATAGEHMAMLLDLLKNEIATFNNPYDIYERIDDFKDVMETIEAIAEAPKEKEYISKKIIKLLSDHFLIVVELEN